VVYGQLAICTIMIFVGDSSAAIQGQLTMWANNEALIGAQCEGALRQVLPRNGSQ